MFKYPTVVRWAPDRSAPSAFPFPILKEPLRLYPSRRIASSKIIDLRYKPIPRLHRYRLACYSSVKVRRGDFKRTGSIWRERVAARSRMVENVTTLLEREYGRPRFGNPRDPMSDLVYVILSNKTSPSMAQGVYRLLQKTFKGWGDVLDKPPAVLRRILRPAGLSIVKSSHIADCYHFC